MAIVTSSTLMYARYDHITRRVGAWTNVMTQQQPNIEQPGKTTRKFESLELGKVEIGGNWMVLAYICYGICLTF